MKAAKQTIVLGAARGDVPYAREPLKNAPLVEALLEIHAPLTQPYDLVPGALQHELKAEYPTVERVNSVELNNMHFPLAANLVNIRLRSRDGTRLVQCGPEVVTVNVLGIYPGFEEFEKSIRSGLEAFFRIAAPQKPRRLGLRYINMIPAEHALAPDALAVDVVLPGTLPQRRGFQLKSLHPFPDAKGELAISAGYPAETSGKVPGFLLDFDFYNDAPESAELGWILEWAKNAHDVIYQAFRACIGQSTFEKLRGPK